METKNNLPKYWCVQCDGSVEYSKVISYLNRLCGTAWSGANNSLWYGYEGDSLYNGSNCHISHKSFKNNAQILTLEQFIEMSKTIEEWTPKRGELVEVSDSGKDWKKCIFLVNIEGAVCPIRCVNPDDNNLFEKGDKFNTIGWCLMRKIETPTHIELTLEDIADKFGVDVKDLRIKEA